MTIKILKCWGFLARNSVSVVASLRSAPVKLPLNATNAILLTCFAGVRGRLAPEEIFGFCMPRKESKAISADIFSFGPPMKMAKSDDMDLLLLSLTFFW